MVVVPAAVAVGAVQQQQQQDGRPASRRSPVVSAAGAMSLARGVNGASVSVVRIATPKLRFVASLKLMSYILGRNLGFSGLFWGFLSVIFGGFCRGVAAMAVTKVAAELGLTSGEEEEGSPEDILIVENKQRQDEERVGVLLLNLGGPDTLEDVQPFLYNLFADPVTFLSLEKLEITLFWC